MIKTCFTICLSLMYFVSLSQQGRPKPVNILFVGNSYTYFNNLPQICSGMAASMGDVLIAE